MFCSRWLLCGYYDTIGVSACGMDSAIFSTLAKSFSLTIRNRPLRNILNKATPGIYP